MLVNASPKANFVTDDIIVGMGEVPARRIEGGLAWALPGNQLTRCRDEATAVASKMDKIIRANMARTNRRLFV